MSKIDLSTGIPAFCAARVGDPARTRVNNVLHRNVGLQNIREVCSLQESELLRFRSLGLKSYQALKEALCACGLRLGMTRKELRDYERAFMDESGITAGGEPADETRQGENTGRGVDWEQRRWELYAREMTSLDTSPKIDYQRFASQMRSRLEWIDAYIAEYRKSLDTQGAL